MMGGMIAGPLLTAVLLGVSAPQAASHDTWPSFRNNGVAVEAELGEIDPARMAWRVELPGTGHGSPVVWKERVFATCEERQSDEVGLRRIVCLDAASGEARWTFEEAYGRFRTHKLNRPGSCSSHSSRCCTPQSSVEITSASGSPGLRTSPAGRTQPTQSRVVSAERT